MNATVIPLMVAVVGVVVAFIERGSRQLNRRFDALSGEVDAPSGELKEFRQDTRGDITALRSETRSDFLRIDDRITELDRHMNTRFDAVNGRFDDVYKRFDEVNNRFDAVNGRFDDVYKRFDEVNGRFDVVYARFDDVQARIEGFPPGPTAA